MQKLYSRRVPGSQRKRRVRQGYGPGKQPTRNCSPSSGEKSRITGGFSSGGRAVLPMLWGLCKTTRCQTATAKAGSWVACSKVLPAVLMEKFFLREMERT